MPVLAQLPPPLALLEVGAAAGLCLLPDLYSYGWGYKLQGGWYVQEGRRPGRRAGGGTHDGAGGDGGSNRGRRRLPRLLSPNHKHVAQGRIRLVVDVPLKPTSHGVFIAVSRSRKLDRYGHLKVCGSTSDGCDFVSPTHWKGHDYSYVAPFNFPGYWSVTPGKYYWQAHYYSAGQTGVYWSGIGRSP